MVRCPESDVIHHLPLAAARAADNFFERDVVENSGDRAIDFRPDWFELTCLLLVATVREVSRIEARELNERAAHGANYIADRDLRRRPRQGVAALHASPASHDIDPFQYLHDLKQEFHRNALAFGNVLHTNRGFAVII